MLHGPVEGLWRPARQTKERGEGRLGTWLVK